VRWGGIDWIDLAQGRDRWRSVVNAVMNFRVSQSAGKFFTKVLLAFHEGLCSVDLVSEGENELVS